MTVWKKHDLWMYEYFDRDIEPEMLPGFEDLVQIWREKRGARPAPAWRDFGFQDFTDWYGRITVSDVSYEPFDFRYRLFGETVAEQFMADHTGKLFSELVASGEEPEEDMAFYEMACRKMLITRTSGQLYWVRRPNATATFIEFPLSDDGKTTTHLLEAMI